MKKLRVTIEGKTYEVLVEVLEDTNATPVAASVPPAAPPAPAPVAAPPQPTAPMAPPAPARVTGSTPGDVACPLTGKVVSIDVKVGGTVQEGTQVATVEAMKMNTYIYAPRAGQIIAILVNPGDGVEEGAVLLRIG